MANTNAPSGLQWLGDLSSGQLSGMVNKYIIPSSDSANYFVGDPVKSTGTSVNGVPTVTAVSAGNTIRGVIVDFEFNPDNLDVTYGVGSTTRTALVVDSPYAQFTIQANAALAATDLAANADISASVSGSTVSGLSGVQLDVSTIPVTPTDSAQLRIIRLYDIPNNTLTEAYSKVVVMINEHEFKTTAGV